MHPGSFAIVMATGIMAVTAEQQDLGRLAAALYIVALGSYIVLALLLGTRIATHRARVVADLTSHTRGFAFLTIVAGTNVLGSASASIHRWWGFAGTLWWAGVVLWVVLTYAGVISVVLRREKPALGAGINGNWFLLAVSTQSVAVLGALRLGHHPNELLAFGCIAAFLLGLVLYLLVMCLVFLRWTFHAIDPNDVDPTTWIAAGAMAITALAGSNLLEARAASPRIDRIAPVIEALVILSWATATFWLPLLLAIGIWRHVVHRIALRYDPSYWALVFPLGMYGAATFAMRAAIGPDDVEWLPRMIFVLALGAWTMAFVGLVRRSGRGITARGRRPGSPSQALRS